MKFNEKLRAGACGLIAVAGLAACVPAPVTGNEQTQRDLAAAQAWVDTQPASRRCHAWVEFKFGGVEEVLVRCDGDGVLAVMRPPGARSSHHGFIVQVHHLTSVRVYPVR